MRTALVIASSIALASCGTPDPGADVRVPDAGVADTGVSTPLTAEEQALVGTWVMRRTSSATTSLRFGEILRDGRMGAFSITVIDTQMCPGGDHVANTNSGPRSWSAEGGVLHFGALQCILQESTWCNAPGPTVECPEMASHSVPYSLTDANTLVLGTDGVGEGGTYVRQ